MKKVSSRTNQSCKEGGCNHRVLRDEHMTDVTDMNDMSDTSEVCEDSFPYRSLSSVARRLLPEAEELHGQGMSWRKVARHLDVSPSTLFVWLRLKRREAALEREGW